MLIELTPKSLPSLTFKKVTRLTVRIPALTSFQKTGHMVNAIPEGDGLGR